MRRKKSILDKYVSLSEGSGGAVPNRKRSSLTKELSIKLDSSRSTLQPSSDFPIFRKALFSRMSLPHPPTPHVVHLCFDLTGFLATLTTSPVSDTSQKYLCSQHPAPTRCLKRTHGSTPSFRRFYPGHRSLRHLESSVLFYGIRHPRRRPSH